MTKEGSNFEVTLNDHEDRIVKLEKSDIEKELRIKRIEDNYIRLENTIMTENRETRDILREGMRNQWELIKSRDEKKELESVRNHDFRKTKFEKRTELIVKILTIGGVGYLLIQSLIETLVTK